MRKERFDSIDGLKGLLSILIMVCHLQWTIPRGEELGLGYFAYVVDIFIALSGFLTAYNHKEKIAGEEFLSFFSKRYFKLIPLYWITNLCMYFYECFVKYMTGNEKCGNHDAVCMILKMSGFYTGWFTSDRPCNKVTWTICCLFLCYCIYYCICKISKKSQSLYIILCAVVFFVTLYYVRNLNLDFPQYMGICTMCDFAFGLLLYEIYSYISNVSGKIIFALFLIADLIFLGLGSVYSDLYLTNYTVDNHRFMLLVVTPVLFFGVMYVKPLKLLFSTKIFKWFGSISMSLYMWHFVVINILNFDKLHLKGNNWGWSVMVALAIGVAAFSHFIFEPIINKGMKKALSIAKKED
ncbi:MAG: acyltransferase [Lachnospiraceae bacterium]|nr:acyltransferase [Lachnospiraceae bacterium]